MKDSSNKPVCISSAFLAVFTEAKSIHVFDLYSRVWEVSFSCVVRVSNLFFSVWPCFIQRHVTAAREPHSISWKDIYK